MKMYRYGLFVTMLLGFLLGSSDGAFAQRIEKYKGLDVYSGKMLVKYDRRFVGKVNGVSLPAETRAQEVLSRINGQVSRRIGKTGIEVWNFNGDIKSSIALARTIPGAVVIPDYAVSLPDEDHRAVPASRKKTTSTEGPDEYLDAQWGLNNSNDADIDAFEAWEIQRKAITSSGDTVYVVVMDTGIDKDHPDLVGNVVPNASGWNYDAVMDSYEPTDENGHGTHVAGTIGAVGNNSIGVSGVAQVVKMIDVRVLNASGRGSLSGILAGWDYVTTLLENNVPVVAVNQSLGGYFPYEFAELGFVELAESIARHHATFGTVWVVAAGNDAEDLDYVLRYSWPNQFESSNIVSIGSTTAMEEKSSFSNHGAYTVDLGAPGSSILSTIPVFQNEDSPYGYKSGTSMATPHVAGVFALAASQHPHESAVDRVGRVFAGADYFSQYGSFWQSGRRLNAYNVVAPDSNSEEAPILYTPFVRFNLNAIDSIGTGVAGFVNTTSSTFDITSVSITGADAAHFAIVNPIIPDTLISHGSFGIDLTFDALGDTSYQFEAQLVIETEIGDRTIDLQAFQTRYSILRLDPQEDIRTEPIAWGTEETSSFFIHNDGDGGMGFGIGQMLVMRRPEEDSLKKAFAKPIATQKRPRKASAVGSNVPAKIKALAPKISARLADQRSAKVTLKSKGILPVKNRLSEHVEEILLWEDSLNNPLAVDTMWAVLDFSDTDSVTTNWDYTEIEPDNWAFLFGDTTDGYKNNSVSAAMSPVFDFSEISAEGVGPAHLSFDYAAQLEEGYDIFGVAIFIDGSFSHWVDATDAELMNDGYMNRAMLSVHDLIGLSEVQFAFIGMSDSEYVEGFGAMFDNVSLTIVDAPFFSNQYQGSVLPGESTEMGVTVRTSFLPEGRFALLTFVASNAINISTEDVGLGIHVFSFATLADIAMSISPDSTSLGEIPRNVRTTSTFEIANSGTVDFQYHAHTVIFGELTAAKALTRPEMKTTNEWVQQNASVAKRVKTANNNRSSQERLARLYKRAKASTYVPKKQAQLKTAPVNRLKSKIFKTPTGPATTDHRRSVYYEDFEASSDFPSDWDVYDDSEFGGTVWEIASLNKADSDTMENTPEQRENVVLFGDKDSLTFEPLSNTVAYSPYIMLPEIEEGTTLMLEFDYASLLDAESDIFALALHVEHPNDPDSSEVWFLGSNQDVFQNDGEIRFTGFDLSRWAGQEVYFGFYLETDLFYNTGAFFFDNIMLDEVDLPGWITPNSGFLAAEETAELSLTIDGGRLFPGEYAAVTFFNYGIPQAFPRFDAQLTRFSLRNNGPMAFNDTLGIRSGDVIPFPVIGNALVENDTDADNDELWVIHATDPVYSDWKRITYNVPAFWDGPTHLVAPLNYDGFDRFEYLVTDGMDIDTAVVILAVHDRPRFVRGVQQQYTVLEDTSLVISTIKLAAGVGGVDKDLFVWGRSHHQAVRVEQSNGAHFLRFKGAEDFWGQTTATLYVGHEGMPMDSMRVTLVVVPVNDAPTANFDFQSVEGKIAFNDLSDDAKDPEGAIVSWHWDFGNGETSEEQHPVVAFSETKTYVITLRVTDNGGLTSEYSTEISATANEAVSVPKAFAVYQNFPNPFNPTTAVRFDLPAASQVTITVYNTLGQTVAKVMQSNSMSAGQHMVSFDASKLASGLYLYRIEAKSADGKVQSSHKKMTLLK